MYHFDEIIDRRNTNASSTDGFRGYIFRDKGVLEFPYKDEEFIRMWLADMDFAVADVILNGIRDRLDRRILGYTQVSSPDYYNAFVKWCKERYDWIVPREKIVMSPGVVPALYDLVQYICDPGDQVLFLTPSYAPFKYATVDSGTVPVYSDLVETPEGWCIDFADLEAKAADEKTKLFILCSPHNPTGRVWTEAELAELSRIIRKYNLWVVTDEIHCDLLRQGQIHTPLAKVMPDYEKLVTCMAPSKTFNLAGLMISHIIINSPELLKTWNRHHFGSENPLSLAAAQAAYENGWPWLSALREYLDENFRYAKDYFAEHLPEAGFRIPEATYLGWVDLRSCFSPEEDLSLFFALNAGVLLEGGKMFVQNGEGFIRLNLACPRPVLTEGLRRICEAVNKR